MCGHEGEIILFEATVRELNKMGDVPLHSTESMKTELADLAVRKETLYAEYASTRNEVKAYEAIRQNVNDLLSVPKEQDHPRNLELE